MESIYLGEFENEDDIIYSFRITEEDIKDTNILFAIYEYENYSGMAFVLFEQDGKLYEVNGAHCSCYGLEYQWEPEETKITDIKYRLTEGELGYYNYNEDVYNKILLEYIKENWPNEGS